MTEAEREDKVLKTLNKIHRSYSTIERFVRYMHGAYSLVSIYEREFRPENANLINHNTIQALYVLLELFQGFIIRRSYPRIGCSNIPDGPAKLAANALKPKKRKKRRRPSNKSSKGRVRRRTSQKRKCKQTAETA